VSDEARSLKMPNDLADGFYHNPAGRSFFVAITTKEYIYG
jgi:hypothetical protein